MSARENLVFYARLYRVQKTRVEELLAMVGMTERAADKVQSYSNGMKQRLLIARALLHKPEVLFLDEPTRGLDPHIARDIRGMVASLAKSGMTVFLTTHYMEEADQLCRHVAFLDRGHIVALDAPAHLKSTYGKNDKTPLEDVFIQLTGSELEQGNEEL
jgi:ABC-2 type transport system ATP-binding protein